jgi:hypothetical protein
MDRKQLDPNEPEVRLAAAKEFAALIKPLLDGSLSANAQAAELNRQGVKIARGGKWTARSVLNLKARV